MPEYTNAEFYDFMDPYNIELPYLYDTFDWPQWPALDVSDSGVIEYFQSMVSLGNPVGFNLENPSTPVAPSAP